jgi:hypothetical protein
LVRVVEEIPDPAGELFRVGVTVSLFPDTANGALMRPSVGGGFLRLSGVRF